jgi:exosortase H (IPTLxxWG-CTERM-specific)
LAKGRINKEALKAIARLYLTFGGILLIFIIAFHIDPIYQNVVVPFTAFVAAASKFTMNIFGANARVHNCILSTPSYSINIVDGCNGIYATAILISGVLAYPSKWSHKLWGIGLGVVAIFVLNLGRVISLFYLGQYYPSVFEEAHVYAWQPIIIIWAIFVWDFWARQSEKRKKVRQV